MLDFVSGRKAETGRVAKARYLSPHSGERSRGYALPCSAAFTRSGVSGRMRSRTPVASNTALASAGPTGQHAASAAPTGFSFGRSISSISIFGTSEKVRIG